MRKWTSALLIIVAVVAVLILAAYPAWCEEAGPAIKAPRLKPLSSITVRLVTAEHYDRKAAGADRTVTAGGEPAKWIITTADADSCVAWVKEEAAEVEAFRACRKAIASHKSEA
jgi:hypothetical protein